jgi:RNA polymerase sigma factor (sigma-70 family)
VKSASHPLGWGGPGGQQHSDALATATSPDSGARPREDELLVRAAAGDRQALADLYAAHRPMAEQVARRTCRPCDVDDVVSEAFAKILDQIRRGGGPRVSFRAYLITAVRHASADTARRRARSLPVDDVDDLGETQRTTGQPVGDQPHSALRLESQLLTDALASLPVRWQLAVWWATVEGLPLSEVGQRLGINPNAAAALAFRAREGLRDAYLALHVDQGESAVCTAWRTVLPALVRGRLGAARAAAATAHLDQCAPCRGVSDHLRDLVAAGVAC